MRVKRAPSHNRSQRRADELAETTRSAAGPPIDARIPAEPDSHGEDLGRRRLKYQNITRDEARRVRTWVHA